MSYTVVTAGSVSELMRKVLAKKETGWKPLGGIAIERVLNELKFFQAME